MAFSRPNCLPFFGGSTLKRVLSISYLILPPLALTSTHSLSAQTVVVDKTTLIFSGQFGGPAVSQTVNVTSSTGGSMPFAFSVPTGSAWLKANGKTFPSGNTPAAVTDRKSTRLNSSHANISYAVFCLK